MNSVRFHNVVNISIPLIVVGGLLCGLPGCNNDAEILQRAKRNQKAQLNSVESKVDHLSEATNYLAKMVELDRQAATRQITYHLNAWLEDVPKPDGYALPEIAQPMAQQFPEAFATVRPDSEAFLPSDADYLRRCYLLRQVADWVSFGPLHDSILKSWLTDSDNGLGDDALADLQKACRLFDWTIRNVQLEPARFPESARRVAPKNLPPGLPFDGPGYRQTLEEALWRGTGDGLQRARVFMALCRQVDVNACMLAVKHPENGQPLPWLVGVRAGQQIYLFDLVVGIHVPGPNQQGIATLAEAKEDSSILRRMNVPGLFDYPIEQSWVEKVDALFDIATEAVSWRMRTLEEGLTGDARMHLAHDPKLVDLFQNDTLIEEVRPWPIDIIAQRYQVAIQRAMVDDLKVLFDQQIRWGMLAPSQPLAAARWKHLTGQIDKNAEEDVEGARVLYMQQRIADSDIENLPYDVNLQMQMNARRQPGQSQEHYDQQLQIIQANLRRAKQAATFWLALIQFEDERYENAATWQQKRVLDRETVSPWTPSARYNVARSLEHLDKTDEAVDYYKTQGDPQEHGNRIRARLLTP
ncbi:MAG: hypothetical protein R3C05_02240 [Pirellulaceae bacterium]